MKGKLYETLAKIKYNNVPNPKTELRELYKIPVPSGTRHSFKNELYKNIKKY